MLLVYQQLLLLVLGVLIIYTHQQIADPEFMKKYVATRTSCINENGIKDTDVSAAWKLPKFPDDPKLKCYFKCMQVAFGVLDSSGDVVDAAFKYYMEQIFREQIAKEAVEECSHLNGTDLCQTAFNLMGCVLAATLD